jgi:Destabilase
MLKLFIIAVLFSLVVSITAEIDNKCLGCICRVESGCKPLGCHMDVGSLSCGYYQIKESYWTDCGRPGGSLEACGKSKSCSDECVHAYMKRYGTVCTHGRTPTCEDYARIHNGGPNGCHEAATLPYWRRVKTCYG